MFPRILGFAVAFGWSAAMAFASGANLAANAGPRRPGEARAASSSFPDSFYPIGDRALFSAETPETGYELWLSDATVAGTRLLVDLCPGPCSPQATYPFATLGDRLFFGVDSASGRPELWVTEGSPESTRRLSEGHRNRFENRATGGTPAGTRLLHAFTGNVRSFALAPSGGAVVGDRVLFQIFRGRRPGAANAVRKIELWATDGTSGGTTALADLCRGECFADNSWIWPDQRHAYVISFSGVQREIWATDGTADGTRKIARGTLDFLGPAGPDFYFSRMRRSGDAGLRLDVWATDGTAEGTRAVTRPPISPVLDFVWPAGHAAGKLLFAGYDELHGVELWVSDGTEEGTHLLVDLDPTESEVGTRRNAFP